MSIAGHNEGGGVLGGMGVSESKSGSADGVNITTKRMSASSLLSQLQSARRRLHHVEAKARADVVNAAVVVTPSKLPMRQKEEAKADLRGALAALRCNIHPDSDDDNDDDEDEWK